MMMRLFLKSKIHRATVTESHLDYEGSIGIDAFLLEKAEILPNEYVQIYNINNGERFETYAIPEPAGSRKISLNGAAARLVQPGDRIIIVSRCWLSEEEITGHQSLVVILDEKNEIKRVERK